MQPAAAEQPALQFAPAAPAAQPGMPMQAPAAGNRRRRPTSPRNPLLWMKSACYVFGGLLILFCVLYFLPVYSQFWEGTKLYSIASRSNAFFTVLAMLLNAGAAGFYIYTGIVLQKTRRGRVPRPNTLFAIIPLIWDVFIYLAAANPFRERRTIQFAGVAIIVVLVLAFLVRYYLKHGPYFARLLPPLSTDLKNKDREMVLEYLISGVVLLLLPFLYYAPLYGALGQTATFKQLLEVAEMEIVFTIALLLGIPAGLLCILQAFRVDIQKAHWIIYLLLVAFYHPLMLVITLLVANGATGGNVTIHFTILGWLFFLLGNGVLAALIRCLMRSKPRHNS